MLVVIDLDGRINAATDWNIFNRAILARDFKREVLLRLQACIEANDVEGFSSVELQGLSGCAFLELERQNAHTDEV